MLARFLVVFPLLSFLLRLIFGDICNLAILNLGTICICFSFASSIGQHTHGAPVSPFNITFFFFNSLTSFPWS